MSKKISFVRSIWFVVIALGSRVNNHKRRAGLLEFDLNRQQIAKLRGPAGLGIGGYTPAEIAVSITAAKNQKV